MAVAHDRPHAHALPRHRLDEEFSTHWTSDLVLVCFARFKLVASVHLTVHFTSEMVYPCVDAVLAENVIARQLDGHFFFFAGHHKLGGVILLADVADCRDTLWKIFWQ